MNGLTKAPDGANMQDSVYGWDKNFGAAFRTIQDALSTIDYDKPDWGSLWKIDWRIYELVPLFGNKPAFIPYNEQIVWSRYL